MTVAANLAAVKERIWAACRRSGRDPAEVRIVAVTKTHPAETVAEAIAAGVEAIGENRVQEAAAKRSLVASAVPWHLIGPLQRNKARLALETFQVIQTVDRPAIADRLEQLASEGGVRCPVFLEVNIAGEATKHGVAPGAARALLEHVVTRCPHLVLQGLMTVPPWSEDPQEVRPHFVALARLAEQLSSLEGVGWLELSMGMSDDFEVAVEEGAHWVRLGRVLFGQRR
jgi:hypothetical protein